MLTLPDNWLDLAASHGATKWVKQFIKTYLPQLKDQQISAEAFALALDEELQSRQLTTPAQQKNYRSNLCQALKVLDLNHPAIALISPTTEQYRDLNDAQRGRLADRQTKYFTSAQAEALVEQAKELLNSAEWADVAAGLAVLIGRRISEILLSRFAPKSEWSILFFDPAKQREVLQQDFAIEIPTLAPAALVLQAITRLQRSLRIDDLRLEGVSERQAKRQVNERFSAAVAAACDRHFAPFVPPRQDKDNLYTHVFRACYATIAAHWFCPPTVPEHQFKAEIQGHFTLAKDGKKLPNYSARANYDDYAIGSEDGNRDGRLGIKLGLLPGLQVIEAFGKTQSQPQMQPMNPTTEAPEIESEQMDDRSSATEENLVEDYSPRSNEEPTMPKPTAKPKIRRPELHADDFEEMTALMARRGITGSAAEVFHALLEAFKADESEQQQQQTRTVSDLTSSLGWFTNRIDALEKTCQHLQAERDQLQAQQSSTEELIRLRAENHRLRQELQDTQSRLEGIQKFLGGPPTPAHHSTPTHAPTSPTPVATAPALTQTQPAAPKPETPAVRRNRGETTEKLNQIIDTLIAWNTSQEDPDTQLRISIPTIKALASAMGANYQPAIQEILRERAGELDEHHSRLLIGSRHNASVNRKDELLQAIAKDYLGLENWKDVKYVG